MTSSKALGLIVGFLTTAGVGLSWPSLNPKEFIGHLCIAAVVAIFTIELVLHLEGDE